MDVPGRARHDAPLYLRLGPVSGIQSIERTQKRHARLRDGRLRRLGDRRPHFLVVGPRPIRAIDASGVDDAPARTLAGETGRPRTFHPGGMIAISRWLRPKADTTGRSFHD